MPGALFWMQYESWEEFYEALDRERRWWRCWNAGTCDWPEFCGPGDCRRPREEA